MFTNLLDKIKKKFEKTSPTIIILYVVLLVFGTLFLGFVIRYIYENVGNTLSGKEWTFRPHMLIEGSTWLVGAIAMAAIFIAYASISFSALLRNIEMHYSTRGKNAQ